LCGLERVRNDNRDRLTVVENPVVVQQRQPLVQPGTSRNFAVEFGAALMGQQGDETRHAFGVACIERANTAGGDRRLHDDGVHQPR
jgi:hypothetical protein